MKSLNEVKSEKEIDGFEIIDLEEKLDFKPWIGNGDTMCCNKIPSDPEE